MPDPMGILSSLITRFGADPESDYSKYAADQTSGSDYLRPPFPSPSPRLLLGSRSLVPVMDQANAGISDVWRSFLQNQLKPTFVYDRNIPAGQAFENKSILSRFLSPQEGMSFFRPKTQTIGIGQHLPETVVHELTHATSNQWPGRESRLGMGFKSLIQGQTPDEEYIADSISGTGAYGKPPNPEVIKSKVNDLSNWVIQNYVKAHDRPMSNP